MVKSQEIKKQIIFLCVLAVIVWSLNLFLHPDFFHSPDAAIYANVARNIIQGKGATVDSTLPLLLTYYPPSPGPWPSPYPLLFPLTVAFSFLIFGISEFSSALINGLFFVAALPLIYLLAEKFFNKKVAVVSSLWYIFNPNLLYFSISGMTESLFIFLMTASIYLLFLEKNSFLFLSGVLIGLSFSTRFQGFLVLPIILGFVWFKKRRLLPLICLFIGFVSVTILSKFILPPIAEDYVSLNNHHLWTSIAEDSVFKNGVGRVIEPITFQLIRTNLKLVIKKVVFNLYYLAQGLLTSTTPSLVVLYILSFFAPFSQKIRQFRLLTISLLLILAFFHLITIFNFRYLHPLLPLIIIIAAAAFLSFLEKFNPKKLFPYTAIFTFFFIIIPCFTSPGWGTSIQRALARPRKPTIISILGKIAKDNTPPEAIIVSNEFAHLAWYGERKTIQWPANLDDFEKIDKEVVPVDAIFLSSHDFQTPLGPGWQELVDNPGNFGDFRFAKKFKIKPEENYYGIPVKAVLYLKKSGGH